MAFPYYSSFCFVIILKAEIYLRIVIAKNSSASSPILKLTSTLNGLYTRSLCWNHAATVLSACLCHFGIFKTYCKMWQSDQILTLNCMNRWSLHSCHFLMDRSSEAPPFDFDAHTVFALNEAVNKSWSSFGHIYLGSIRGHGLEHVSSFSSSLLTRCHYDLMVLEVEIPTWAWSFVGVMAFQKSFIDSLELLPLDYLTCSMIYACNLSSL